MTFDIDKFISDLEVEGETKGLSKELVDKAISFTRDFYQKEHDEPDIQDSEPDTELPDIPTLKGKKCSLCGNESLMLVKEKRKPCLVCGFVNV